MEIGSLPGSSVPAPLETRIEAFDHTLFEITPWLVALGDPGSGKTTALKKLVLEYVEQARDQVHAQYSGIPVFVYLRDFARHRRTEGQGYSLLDFIYDYAKGSLSVTCSRGFFEHYLEAGECLVCFDGLDEVAISGQRQEIRDVVEGFIRRYPRNRYVITSRRVGYDQAPLSRRLFPHCTVQPLADEGIGTYIRQWYKTREKSPVEAEKCADELIGTIMASDRLHDLARNPLLLAIIAIVHRVGAKLPYERVTLYDKCTEVLLKLEEEVKRIERTDYEKEYYKYRQEILEAVAYWMQTELADQAGREVLVSEAELHSRITRRLHEDPTFGLSKADAWQQASSFIRFIRERTGLIVERGREQFTFMHLTFQEYFAASYIWRNYPYDLDEVWDLIKLRLFDPTWREVILLLLGKLNQFPRVPSQLVERILTVSVKDEPILRRGLNLATNCIVDNIRLNISLQQQIVEQWIDILRSPLCNNQARMALIALDSVKQYPVALERLPQLAADANEPAQLRAAITSLYISDYISEKVTSNWVFETLSGIACDSSASEQARSVALAHVFRLDSHIESAFELASKLASMDRDSASVCANVLIGREHGEGLWQSVFSPKGRLPAKEDLVRFVETEPRFALILSNMGWEDAWPFLIKYLQETNESPEQLGRLLIGGYKVIQELGLHMPEPYQEMMIAALVDIVKLALDPYSAEAIHWLLSLDYPAEGLFDLVLEFDAQVDRDDWNIKVMSPFFEDLLRRARWLWDVSPGEDHTQPILGWADKIMKTSHLTLQMSFFSGLCRLEIEIVKELAMDLVEQGADCGTIFALTRPLADYGVLNLDEANTLVRPLLARSENWWARSFAAHYLHEIGSLDSQTTTDILFEVADGITVYDDEWVFLKQEAAYTAARLGAVEHGAQILCEVITGSHKNEAAKNAAFDALQEIVTPDLRVALR